MFQRINMTTGQALEFTETADFFRMMHAPADVEVRFYAQGREVGFAIVKSGYAERFGAPFDRVRLTSTATQPVEFVTRLGNTVSYDKPPSDEYTALLGAIQNLQLAILSM